MLEKNKMLIKYIFRVYHWYSKEIIPVLGELIASDWKSYQYLVESIQKFPNQVLLIFFMTYNENTRLYLN